MNTTDIVRGHEAIAYAEIYGGQLWDGAHELTLEAAQDLARVDPGLVSLRLEHGGQAEVTDAQIDVLRADAEALGDMRRVLLCDMAFDDVGHPQDYGFAFPTAPSQALTILTPEQARRQCARLVYATSLTVDRIHDDQDLYSVRGDDAPGAPKEILAAVQAHDPAYAEIEFYEVGEGLGETVYLARRGS